MKECYVCIDTGETRLQVYELLGPFPPHIAEQVAVEERKILEANDYTIVLEDDEYSDTWEFLCNEKPSVSVVTRGCEKYEDIICLTDVLYINGVQQRWRR